MSAVGPGGGSSESARAFALGERSGSAAEAALTAVMTATVAARSSVVFISFIFLLCAALRRFVHILYYAASAGIPRYFSEGGRKDERSETGTPRGEEAEPKETERLMHSDRTEDQVPGLSVNCHDAELREQTVAEQARFTEEDGLAM